MGMEQRFYSTTRDNKKSDEDLLFISPTRRQKRFIEENVGRLKPPESLPELYRIANPHCKDFLIIQNICNEYLIPNAKGAIERNLYLSQVPNGYDARCVCFEYPPGLLEYYEHMGLACREKILQVPCYYPNIVSSMIQHLKVEKKTLSKDLVLAPAFSTAQIEDFAAIGENIQFLSLKESIILNHKKTLFQWSKRGMGYPHPPSKWIRKRDKWPDGIDSLSNSHTWLKLPLATGGEGVRKVKGKSCSLPDFFRLPFLIQSDFHELGEPVALLGYHFVVGEKVFFMDAVETHTSPTGDYLGASYPPKTVSKTDVLSALPQVASTAEICLKKGISCMFGVDVCLIKKNGRVTPYIFDRDGYPNTEIQCLVIAARLGWSWWIQKNITVPSPIRSMDDIVSLLGKDLCQDPPKGGIVPIGVPPIMRGKGHRRVKLLIGSPRHDEKIWYNNNEELSPLTGGRM